MQKILRWERARQVQEMGKGSVWREWTQQGEEKEMRSEKKGVGQTVLGHVGNFVRAEMENHWKILNGVT